MKTNLKYLAEIFGVARSTIRSWTEQPDFPIEQKPQSNADKWILDSAKVIEWKLESEKNKGTDRALNTKLKNKKLEVEVERLEIENAKSRNEVVYIDDVRDFIKDKYTRLRQTIRTVPNKVSAQLAHEEDIAVIKEIILKEIDSCLTLLSQPEIKDNHVEMEVEGNAKD